MGLRACNTKIEYSNKLHEVQHLYLHNYMHRSALCLILSTGLMWNMVAVKESKESRESHHSHLIGICSTIICERI